MSAHSPRQERAKARLVACVIKVMAALWDGPWAIVSGR